ncbi:hypothetical protein QQ056_17130 [Oscillatoria laete-virens NRMC-F 0139]|nr:hypothetical protein [Oscillatoria laete-virens]MDL5055257.1 hypothetical protein [Oscillatoria laete-virens NRMC-F 0139]
MIHELKRFEKIASGQWIKNLLYILETHQFHRFLSKNIQKRGKAQHPKLVRMPRKITPRVDRLDHPESPSCFTLAQRDQSPGQEFQPKQKKGRKMSATKKKAIRITIPKTGEFSDAGKRLLKAMSDELGIDESLILEGCLRHVFEELTDGDKRQCVEKIASFKSRVLCAIYSRGIKMPNICDDSEIIYDAGLTDSMVKAFENRGADFEKKAQKMVSELLSGHPMNQRAVPVNRLCAAAQ